MGNTQFIFIRKMTCNRHKADIAYYEHCKDTGIMIPVRGKYRRKSPAQNAVFLQEAASISFGCICDDPDTDTQTAFNKFYQVAIGLLNTYYPECTVTMTSRDLSYITPGLNAKLRSKNRLMTAGRTEEAGA
jgi:hypothetical protein